MDYNSRLMAKVAGIVAIAVVAAIFAIGGAGLVSLSQTTRVGVHSLLSYWAAIPVAVSVLALARRSSRSQIALCSALLFPTFVHMGSAIGYRLDLIQPAVVREVPNLVGDVFELAAFGLLLMAAVWFSKNPDDNAFRFNGIAAAVVLVFVQLGLYGSMWFFLFPLMFPVVLVVLGVIMGILGFSAFVFAAYLSPRLQNEHFTTDTGYLASALVLLGFSTIIMAAELVLPTSAWIYAENLQIAAFILLGLSLGVPFLKRSGLNGMTAHLIVAGLAIITYLPFTITISIEVMNLNIVIEALNRLAFSIIHIGAGSLSAMMAVLLHTFSKRHPSRNHYPLILLFALWAGVAAVSVLAVIIPDLTPLGEPIVPYAVGSLLSLPLLFYAVRWTNPELRTVVSRRASLWLFVGAILLFLAVATGEIVNQLVLQRYAELSGNPVSNSILLGTSLVGMLVFASLIFVLAEQSRGRISIEIYAAFFLSMWIVPNILKSYYTVWTAGWWVSEVLIFIGMLLGPPLMGLFYVRALQDAEDSHDRANLYADLLMHDVSNYNQMLLTALELLGDRGVSDAQRDRVSGDAKQVISFADQLIANVRLIGKTDRLVQSTLKPTNLVATVVEAIDIVTQGAIGEDIELRLRTDRGHGFVLADDALKYVFMNLLYVAFQQPVDRKTILIEIDPYTDSGLPNWRVRMSVPGLWIDQRDREELMHREADNYSSSALGLLVARLITESLGGSFTMTDRLEQEFHQGTVFVVTLPGQEKPEG